MKVKPYQDEIIDMYVNKNMTTVEIAKYFGCSDSSVGRLLNKSGIKPYHTPNEIKIPKDIFPVIAKEYMDGFTTVELAKKYNVADHTIAKIVKSLGVEIRPAYRRSNIKYHNFFNKIDAPEKAYYLGWMLSDGAIVENITRKNRTNIISLEIHSKDIHILHDFATRLGAEADVVKTFNKRNHSYLRFASEEMSNDLAKYGIVPRKSNIATLPIIDDDLMCHLIRGVFDGDGTVTIVKPNYIRFGFYGTKAVCESINIYLHNKINLPIHTVNKTTCCNVWFNGINQAKLFYDYIYQDCDNLFLKRKKEKFKLALNFQYENTEVS